MMSWSLRLQYGDFVVESASLGTATRQRKLLQDIRCALLERMGTDSLHPSYGSLIDGGVTPDGTEVSGVIGQADLDLALLEIESEIQRVVRDYQRKQLDRAKRDKQTYGRATLEPEEVLIELTGINFKQSQDVLKVTIGLQTATGDNFEIELPLETEGDAELI